MDAATGLVWGVKTSWVSYITRMSDGVVSTSGGAKRLDTGEFHFPLASIDEDGARFVGAVRFSGHFGMLDVNFGEFAVTCTEGIVDLSVADDDPDSIGGRRTVLVLEEPTDEAGIVSFARPLLTARGADLFFDNYRPGTRFDRVAIPARALPAAGRVLTSLSES